MEVLPVDLGLLNTLGSISSVWSTGGYLIHGSTLVLVGELRMQLLSTNGITEEYDGTVWSANAYAMSSSRECHYTYWNTNCWISIRWYFNSGGSVSDKTETYDGVLDSLQIQYSGASGTQNAGPLFGGVRVPGLVACSEEWNGTNLLEGK